jgi:hypothetical protein
MSLPARAAHFRRPNLAGVRLREERSGLRYAGRAKVFVDAVEWGLDGDGPGAGYRANENVVHEPEFPKPQNNQAIDVDLVPGVRKVGVPRKAMMVVVQPFTEGEDRGHQLVGRAVIGLEAAITVATVAMADRVDQLVGRISRRRNPPLRVRRDGG